MFDNFWFWFIICCNFFISWRFIISNVFNFKFFNSSGGLFNISFICISYIFNFKFWINNFLRLCLSWNLFLFNFCWIFNIVIWYNWLFSFYVWICYFFGFKFFIFVLFGILVSVLDLLFKIVLVYILKN